MDPYKGNQHRDDGREKNYFFVMRDELPHIDLSKYPSGKKYYGKLFLSVAALQGIFIGCGEIEKRNNQLFDAFTYVKKSPEEGERTFTIPGSSVKGSVLTNLLLLMNLDFKNPSFSQFLSSEKVLDEIYFSDFPIATPGDSSPKTIPARFDPKRWPRNDAIKLYHKEDRIYTRLPQHELDSIPRENILPLRKGSQFSGYINFKLLNEYQLTLLLLAFGCLSAHQFNFKIGGAKNRGMGLIRVEIDHDKSFYSESLRDIAANEVLAFENLEETFVPIISRLKQESPVLGALIKRMQEEYGQ